MPGKGAPAHSIRPIKTTLLASALMVTAAASTIAADQDRVSFKMVVPKGASACLPNAQAQVQIASSGDSEELSLFATGLPPNTSFDLFVIQVPTAPFGLSWYQETSILMTKATPSNISEAASALKPLSSVRAWRRHQWSSPGHSQMDRQTRRQTRYRPIIWAFGSTRQPTQ